jgi:hypothetical protein
MVMMNRRLFNCHEVDFSWSLQEAKKFSNCEDSTQTNLVQLMGRFRLCSALMSQFQILVPLMT